MVCNLLLAGGKIAVGVLTGSVAITADGMNNLSDASSNIVSLVGFKLGARPADSEHPYGHARYEYLAGLAVSVMILVIGVELLKESFAKVLHPTEVAFSWLMVAVLIASILVKLWMSRLNRQIGTAIDSETLLATAADARNDVITTAAVLAATILTKLTGFARIDGLMGIGVAAFICTAVQCSSKTPSIRCWVQRLTRIWSSISRKGPELSRRAGRARSDDPRLRPRQPPGQLPSGNGR